MNKKPKKLANKKVQDRVTYVLFLLPALIAFFCVIVVPFISGIYYSFTNWTGIPSSDMHWVGLKNYIDAFQDNRFHYSILVTLLVGGLNFIVINIVSFALALLVSSKLKGRNVYRAGFFLPNLIGGLVLGYIWQFIYNQIVPNLGIKFFEANNHYFLVNPKMAIIALVITQTWQYAGYIMMIYYTALQNISKELLESAEIDGCTGWQRLRKITIPLIMPTFTITLFLTLSSSMKMYDVIISLTNGGPSMLWNGEAINATEMIAVNIYKTATVENHMALGQAKAILFFIGLAVLTLIQTHITRSKEIDA